MVLKPSRSFKRFAGGIIGGLATIFLVIGFLYVVSGVSGIQSSGKLILLLLLFMPVFAVSVLLHEIGHLAGGVAAGMQPLVLTVGPLSFFFDGGIRLKRHGFFPGGFTACLPASGTHNERRVKGQILSLIGGGPVMSLAVVFSSATLVVVSSGIWSALGLIFAAVNFIIFVLTALPGTAGLLHTDGSRFLSVWRQTPEGKRWMKLMPMQSVVFSKIRPKNWPFEREELEENLADYVHSSHEYLAIIQIILWTALDRSDLELAQKYLKILSEQLPRAELPDLLKSGTYSELAVLHLFLLGDKERAENFAELVTGGPFDEDFFQPLYTALLLETEKENKLALAELKQARDTLDHCRMRALRPLYMDIIEQISSRIKDDGLGQTDEMVADID